MNTLLVGSRPEPDMALRDFGGLVHDEGGPFDEGTQLLTQAAPVLQLQLIFQLGGIGFQLCYLPLPGPLLLLQNPLQLGHLYKQPIITTQYNVL